MQNDIYLLPKVVYKTVNLQTALYILRKFGWVDLFILFSGYLQTV